MSTSSNHSQTGRLSPHSLLKQRYTIVEQAGRGGMGAVYQAMDTYNTPRRVAIKEMSQVLLNSEQLTSAKARFQQEADILGSLKHANLPRIYDAFSENGRSYLVMDFIDGKTLQQIIKEQKGKGLPVTQVLFYAQQLCDVLAYLHQQNPPIIFRDVKPTNVMVTKTGQVYLIDFGIARFFKEGQVQDTTLLGSPGYAPPEQHGRSQTTPRSDIYGLGATLHYSLTGRDPYYATTPFTFSQIRQHNPQVPPELDQLIQRMVAADETQRPASTREIQQTMLNIIRQASAHTSGPHTPSSDSAKIAVPPQAARPAPQPIKPVITPQPIPPVAPPQPVPPAGPPPNAIPPTQPSRSASSPTLPAQQMIYTSQHAAITPPPQGIYQPITPPRLTQSHPVVQQAVAPPQDTSIWSRGFTILFSALFLITVGSGVLVMSLLYPDAYGWASLFEAGLSLLLLVLVGSGGLIVTQLAAQGLFLSMFIIALISGFTALALGSLDVQQMLDGQFSTSFFDQGLTICIALAAALSFCWLIRAQNWEERISLLTLSGLAGICVIIATTLTQPTAVIKHLLLLVAQIALIQGSLLAIQIERVAHNQSGNSA